MSPSGGVESTGDVSGRGPARWPGRPREPSPVPPGQTPPGLRTEQAWVREDTPGCQEAAWRGPRSESGVPRPAAAAPKNSVEMQALRPPPDLLTQALGDVGRHLRCDQSSGASALRAGGKNTLGGASHPQFVTWGNRPEELGQFTHGHTWAWSQARPGVRRSGSNLGADIDWDRGLWTGH